MGIKTEKENIGDVYLLRKSSLFTKNEEPNIKLEGYDYVSQMIVNSQDMMGPPEETHAKILSYAFNRPIVVNDYRAFFSLANMFKAQIFVIYCNPND